MALIAGALLTTSCAYYNTFYLARKYYERGAGTLPYPVEKATAQASNEYKRSIDYSKKLLSQYPDSKWVDDAYLLWARALLGRDDPLETVNLLEGFASRFPDSDLRDEARFYLGVGYQQSRKYLQALSELDTFLVRAPRHDLVPFAHLERSRALFSLERFEEAAAAAGEIVTSHPKSGLQHQAYTARAEALLRNGDHVEARQDFQVLGERSRTDDERLGYVLREADCLEAARDFDAELALLENALAYEIEPVRPDSGAIRLPGQQMAGFDRFGRILMRIGTAQLLAGRLDDALASYRRIVEVYPKTALGAEAQYRIGYAYETVGDDFALARVEYDRVKDQTGASGFGLQALQRSQNLARLEQYRSAAGDSAASRSDAGFVLAEQYLFQTERPERALEEYRKLAQEFAGTAVAAKALTAEAWVLARKLDRQAEADSVLWVVVREYPATESQLAARDYLERSGHVVPSSLIRMPEPPPPPPPPAPAPAAIAPVDSVLGPEGAPRRPPFAPTGQAADSLRQRMFERMPFAQDSMRFAPGDSVRFAPADTLPRIPAAPDSTMTPPDPGAPDGIGDDAPEQR
jgi:tetratricopeptide (TPR) repeat protein